VTVDGRDFYRRNKAVGVFTRATGWQNPGEELAVRQLAPRVRGKRILDVGVGGGRTISFISMLSDDYVGIDFSEPMIESAKARYPDVDLRVADARDLAQFETGSVDFVFFSYNGVDTMDATGRSQVFAAVHRVLAEDGIFALSTLNRDGRSFRESPVQLRRPGTAWQPSVLAAAHLVWRNLKDPQRLFRRIYHWRQNRRKYEDHDGWGTSALAATDFILLNHFVTLARLREELDEAGFDVVDIYGSDNGVGPLAKDAITSSDDSFHAVAQRRTRE
jgi:SAM-dependent methyltransferase